MPMEITFGCDRTWGRDIGLQTMNEIINGIYQANTLARVSDNAYRVSHFVKLLSLLRDSWSRVRPGQVLATVLVLKHGQNAREVKGLPLCRKRMGGRIVLGLFLCF